MTSTRMGHIFAGGETLSSTGQSINSMPTAVGRLLTKKWKERLITCQIQTVIVPRLSAQTVAVTWDMFSWERDLPQPTLDTA